MNRNNYLKHAPLYGCMFLLLVITGCGEDQDVAKQETTPEVIQKVDDLLSQPYDAHFKNIQGDYATAHRIAGAIQGVIDATEFRSKHLLLPLIDVTEDLMRNPTEEHYASLQKQWKESRPKVNLAEKEN